MEEFGVEGIQRKIYSMIYYRTANVARHAEVHFYETGHFALETHAREIANAIGKFLRRNLAAQTAGE